MTRYILMLCTALAVTAARAPALDTISLWPDQEIGRIDPHLYGHFLEHIHHSVVDGLCGQLVRDPSFEEPSATLGDGWTLRAGAWRFDGQELSGGGMADAHVLAGDPAWRNYSLSVEAKKESGQEGFLIIFRALDADNFYWWNLGGWGNDRSAVEQEVNGHRTLVPGTRTETRIEADRWYTITVTVAGEDVACLLDGERLVSFKDTAHGRGAIGLGAWVTDVRYRKARVTSGDQLLWEMARPPESQSSVAGGWRAAGAEAGGLQLTQSNANPLNSQWCQRVCAGKRGGGIAQDGLAVADGVAYEGSVWLRGKGKVAVVLDPGEFPEQCTLDVRNEDWLEYSLRFRPYVSTDNAALSIRLLSPGEVSVDLCTLYRTDTPFRPCILDKVRAIAPSFLRWPGGCYAEHYRWKDGIGAPRNRVTRPNYVWGGLDPNLFGTAEFIQLCKALQADPVIVLNIGHHRPLEERTKYIQEALDWLEYCNGGLDTPYGRLRAEHGYPEPFAVRYWEIGNETWGMGAQAYADCAIEFVDALRKKDPTLKYLLCGSGGHNLDWNRQILERAATHMDFLSVHHYMQGTFEEEMQNARDYVDFLRQTANLIQASANPKATIAVTEWNQQSVKLRGGLYAGLLLNGFERNADIITMACPALFIRKTTAETWNNAFINHDSNRAFVAPNYLVMKLYRDHFAPVRIAVDGPEGLDLVATKDPETADIILKAVNPSLTQDITARIDIPNVPNAAFTLWRVYSPDIDDENTLEAPDRIHVLEADAGSTLQFPAHSVTLLRLKRPR